MTGKQVSAEILGRIPIFRGLDETECRQLASIAEPEAYHPREYVLHEGQTSQRLWIVMAGSCEVLRQASSGDGGQKLLRLAVLEPHANFGEMSFFHPAPHSASVRAITPLELLAIRRERFDELMCGGSPAACKLAYNSVHSLADRIRQLDQWIIDRTRREDSGRKVEEWEEFRSKMFGGWNL
ncbi:MAG: cyclic nucleotide-binding domain-containing protein [Planctomycetaceae bacterium]|nr:cyclic nucleotide-binding domain-containing protein [Planctomycetaceae bacterium]